LLPACCIDLHRCNWKSETVEMRGLIIGLMLTFGVALGVYATAASELWAAFAAGALLMFVVYLSTGRRGAQR
jgi:hypothetical protein